MAQKSPKPELPILPFETPTAWEAWLAGNHASPGIWLKLAKKNSGVPSVTYLEAVEVALCYGWIDGQAKSLDETFYLQKFTPRGPHSIWSKINREKALKLIEAGRMQPSGLQAIEQAKKNGRWDAAYDSLTTATVPPDLQAELDLHSEAQAFFDTLDSQNRYAILFRLQTARKPETRLKRIRQFVEMLEKHEKIYP